MAERDYSSDFSDGGFWDKVKDYAKTAGKSVLEPALKMYYSATDAETPRGLKPQYTVPWVISFLQ